MNREEQIEKARELLACGVLSEEACDAIKNDFPELRESEDERIRKGLLDIFKNSQSAYWNGIKTRDIVAYLEKQKEQDECPEYCVRSHCIGCSIYEKRKEQEFNIELIQRSWYMEGYTDGEFKREPMWNLVTGEGGPRYEKNEKYGQPLEQKPAEWSEEDEKMLSNLITHIKVAYGSCDWLTETIAWLKSIRPKPKEEWSEEDKTDLNDTIKYIQNYGETSSDEYARLRTKEIVDWLKSLPYRFSLSSWGEEIRDAFFGVESNWKPSEEQMEALMRAITWLVEAGNHTDSSILANLRSHLKELM